MEAAARLNPESEDLRWFLDNDQLIYAELRNVAAELKPLKHLPHARGRKDEVVPRVLALAQAFLDLTGNRFRETAFTTFFQAFQESTVLELLEVSATVSAMKLVLLERIAARCRCLLSDPAGASNGLGLCVRSLRDITQTSWKEVLEPLIFFDAILRRDPAGYMRRWTLKGEVCTGRNCRKLPADLTWRKRMLPARRWSWLNSPRQEPTAILALSRGNLTLAITLSVKAALCLVKKSASNPTSCKACAPDCAAILTNFSLPES